METVFYFSLLIFELLVNIVLKAGSFGSEEYHSDLSRHVADLVRA